MKARDQENGGRCPNPTSVSDFPGEASDNQGKEEKMVDVLSK